MKRRIVQLIALLPALFLVLLIWFWQDTASYTLRDLGIVNRTALQANPKPASLAPQHPQNASAAGLSSDPRRKPDLPPDHALAGVRYANAAGQVAWSEYRRHDTQINIHAFLSSQGKTVDLGSLGGRNSLVQGLSLSGHVIGISHTASGEQHAFLWRDGAMLDLGTLPNGTISYPYALNARDQVVGMAQTSDGDSHAFSWNEGALTDLGVLPHGTESSACALNDRGDIVGWATTETAASHAVVWQQGQIKDLNRLIPSHSGLVLMQAASIDERGQIETFGTIRDRYHRFLLIPRH